ncbi:MAG: competence protein CoiA [Helicobacteraceae bacterium]|jgi:hypothetical protein|nr:competence protein CoiA [Helicobacteraceae bacterium]
MTEIIAEVRRYHDLKALSDDEIAPFVETAIDEFAGVEIIAGRETKATAYKTLALLGEKIWLKVQQRANEYDETVETFKDVDHWRDYWLDRLNALIVGGDSSDGSFGSFGEFNYGAV